jgi:hypothetical protein
MKTPREILLERHQAAEPKLDVIRRAVVGELNKQETKGQSWSAILVSLFLSCPQKLWRELIWPARRIWVGMAAVWVGIFAVNVSMRDHSQAMTTQSSPAPELIMTFQQQERLLAELTEPHETRTAEPPKRSVPQPRSERRDEISIA